MSNTAILVLHVSPWQLWPAEVLPSQFVGCNQTGLDLWNENKTDNVRRHYTIFWGGFLSIFPVSLSLSSFFSVVEHWISLICLTRPNLWQILVTLIQFQCLQQILISCVCWRVDLQNNQHMPSKVEILILTTKILQVQILTVCISTVCHIPKHSQILNTYMWSDSFIMLHNCLNLFKHAQQGQERCTATGKHIYILLLFPHLIGTRCVTFCLPVINFCTSAMLIMHEHESEG